PARHRDRASAPAVQRHRHATGSLPAVRGCTRPGHRGDPLRCPRRRRLSATQSALPFHHPGPAPARDASESRPPAGRRPGYLLGRRLILVATSTGPQTMVPPNPLPLVKNLILRRYGDLWGGSAKTDPDALTSALRKARISPLSMGYLYQNTAALGFTTLPLLPLIRQRTLVLTGDE